MIRYSAEHFGTPIYTNEYGVIWYPFVFRLNTVRQIRSENMFSRHTYLYNALKTLQTCVNLHSMHIICVNAETRVALPRLEWH